MSKTKTTDNVKKLDHLAVEENHRHGISFPLETKVQQHFYESTKVSNIVKKFQNGEFPQGNGGESMYIDLTNIPEYHQAMNQVKSTEQMFANLPAKIRSRFHNSPNQMIEFCQDPKNLDEAIKLGLAHPSEKPPEIKKPSTPEAVKKESEAEKEQKDSPK